MSKTDASDAPWPFHRLLVPLGLGLLLVAAGFLLYLRLILPIDELGGHLLWGVAGALCVSVVLVLVVAFLSLGPVLECLGAEQPGDELLARAHRRAGGLPRVVGLTAFATWSGVSLWLGHSLGQAGAGVQSSVGGALAALCTGLIASMLCYYLALSELFQVRLSLPGPMTQARSVSIGVRVLALTAAVMALGGGLVGVSAFIHHAQSLDRLAVERCDAVLKALAPWDLKDKQKIADQAGAACGGSVRVVYGTASVRGQVGPLEPHQLPRRSKHGVVREQRLLSGDVVHALVPVGGEGELARRLLFFGLLALVMAAGVALAAKRAITIPVKALAEGVEAIARGDLTREVRPLTGDEIGSLASSFMAMREELRRLVADLACSGDTLSRQVSVVAEAGTAVEQGLEVRRQGMAEATEEMTYMDQSVAAVGRDICGLSDYVSSTGAALAEFAGALDEVRRHGTELERAVSHARGELKALLDAAEATRGEIAALANAARTTLATVGESSRTLRALTEAALESERVAQRLFEETQEGESIVEEGVRGVEAIRGVVAEARSRVEALGARSADITAVVDFIAEVAGRTNLLSLNAAIIAAQAGDQGKPFGVVADQIRELAAQIGSSTKRIGDIIAGVRVEVEATSDLIQQSDQLAAVGVERARESGQALRQIAGEAKRGRAVAATITPAVVAHAESTRQIEHLAAQVVDMAQGFAGVELLLRGGRSIEALAQSLTPLTQKVGRALEEQAAVSRRQVRSLDDITRMIARLNRTVSQHGDGTARVLQRLSDVVALAAQDREAAQRLAQAARALTQNAVALRQGLEQFRT